VKRGDGGARLVSEHRALVWVSFSSLGGYWSCLKRAWAAIEKAFVYVASGKSDKKKDKHT